MDWNKLIRKYDREGMLRCLRSFPKNLLEGALIGRNFGARKKNGIENVIMCGMGGSGASSAILKNLLKNEINVPIEIVHDYELPAYAGKKSLVICVSYSGNTEETVACAKEAKKRKASTIFLATGGMIRKIYGSERDCLIFPDIFPKPRMGFSYIFTPLLIIFGDIGLIKKKDNEINEAIRSLEKQRHKVETTAMEVAQALHGRIPAVYAQAEFENTAYRFCTELNENSKQFCHFHFFPEMNHNEINAFHGFKNMAFVLLRDRKEREKIRERFEVYKKIWGKKFRIIEIFTEGDSLLSRILYMVWLESFISFYLAMLNHEDPADSPIIEFLKKEIKEKKG